MSTDEFNNLLNGPLHHPLAALAITRLALALRAVVDATGDAGAEALRKHCQARQEKDETQ